jgi:carbonic anhydrase
MKQSLFEKHSCEALVIHCIDFRFWQALHENIKKELKIENFDIISLAGGAKNLSSPFERHMLDTILKNAEISGRLHHIKKVILVNHMDCGAYGGSAKFENLEAEIEFHKSELEKAAVVISEKFPNIEIVKMFAYYQEGEEKFINF